MPNSLKVKMKDGIEHCFVLFNRKAWAAAIDVNTTP